MNKSNLTYLLNAWIRLYFQEQDNEELEKRAKKIIDALSMKVDGVKILSQLTIDDLADAFCQYQKAKTELEANIEDEFMDDDYYEIGLRGYIQNIKRQYNTAIYSLKLN